MDKIKKNRIILIILSLIAIGILLTYSIRKGVYTFKKIKLEPVNIVEATGVRKKLGFTKYVETSNAKYYVHSSMNVSDSEITDYVNNSELMFKSAKDELGLLIGKFVIEFSDKLSNSNYKMKYNPHDKNAEGIVFSSIGNGKLPAWLCVGLERHYKEKYGFQKYDYEKFDMVDWLKSNKENNLPGYGDYWFTKDFLKKDSKEKACMISHRFVDYLEKENYLKDIVNSYCNGEKDSFTMTEDQLNKFLKTTNVNITNEVLYTYNNMVITKPKAIYTIENGVETWDTLNGDIDFMEKGMLYIEDTFGKKVHNKVDVSIELKGYVLNKGGTSEYGKITLYNGRVGIIHTAVHEMTHSYLFYEGNNDVFMHRANLEEGLCNYIASKYISLKSDTRRNEDKQILAQFKQTIPTGKGADEEEEKYMVYYKKFNNDKEYDFDLWSRAAYDAAAAYQLFDTDYGKNESVYYNYYRNYFKNGTYEDLEFINSYNTSTSFVYYLLEEEMDLDHFILLMEDLDEFNRQNDKTLSKLVDNWLKYLKKAIY